LIGLGVGVCLALSGSAPSPDELRVLSAEPAEGPRPSQALYAYLRAIANRQIDAREKRIAELRDPDAMRARQREVREAIVRAAGGFPEKTPLRPRVAGVLERDGYRIEKIVYESRPRHYVTANAYVSTRAAPPFPAVLSPCGHDAVGKASRTYQNLYVSLARRGFIVLSYDPIGQGERYQILKDGKPFTSSSTGEHMMAGTVALLLGGTTANFRIWDGIRSLDYLIERGDVDPKRIACTGNSGGGTMTAYLAAVDERFAAAAPSCYITSYRRLLETIGPQDAEQNFLYGIESGLDHADFAEVFAPKPYLICTGTRDYFSIQGAWETFREAKVWYGRLGASEKIDLVEFEDEHGFSPPRRAAVYRFFSRTLLGREDDGAEQPVAMEDEAALRVTETGQVLSSLGGRSVADLCAEWYERIRPKRDKPPTAEAVAGAARILSRFDRAIARVAAAPAAQSPDAIVRDGLAIEKLIIRSEPGVELPALLVRAGEGPASAVIIADGRGKDAELGAEGEIARAAHAGKIVLSIDLRGFGELGRKAGRDFFDEYCGPDWKDASLAFLVGETLVGIRAADLVAARRYLATRADVRADEIDLLGIGEASIPALHAAAFDPGFRAVRLRGILASWASVARAPLSRRVFSNVVPGALTVYDLADLAAAIAPRPLAVEAMVDPLGATLPAEEAARAWGFDLRSRTP